MKIKQIEKGSAEPIFEVLQKLNKNESNSGSSDAFEIVLALFTNTLSKLNIQETQSSSFSEKQEFFNNSQINQFFQQLFKNINNQISSELINFNNLKTNISSDIANPKLLLEQLIYLKNLTQQNNNLNSKIKTILINSLPKEIIQFLKDDKINLTSNTQNELLQIAKIFEKIQNNTNNHIKSIVIENTDLQAHKVERIEDTFPNIVNKENKTNAEKSTEQSTNEKSSEKIQIKQINKHRTEFPQQNTQSSGITKEQGSKISVLTPNELFQEQKSLKTKNINNNLQNNAIDYKNDNSSNEIESIITNNKNTEKSFSNDFSEISNSSQELSNNESRIISQEIKTKSNVDFLNPKMNNFTPKTSNYTIFSSVRPNEVPYYIVRMSNSIREGGNYRAIMNLKPENLGSIFVNLTMKDDVLNIIIKADMQQTLEKIDKSVAQLKEALASSGFKSDNINLKVESNQTDVQNYSSNSREFDSPNRQKQNQELREMIQRIQQYEHILSLVKQQEVVE